MYARSLREYTRAQPIVDTVNNMVMRLGRGPPQGITLFQLSSAFAKKLHKKREENLCQQLWHRTKIFLTLTKKLVERKDMRVIWAKKQLYLIMK